MQTLSDVATPLQQMTFGNVMQKEKLLIMSNFSSCQIFFQHISIPTGEMGCFSFRYIAINIHNNKTSITISVLSYFNSFSGFKILLYLFASY